MYKRYHNRFIHLGRLICSVNHKGSSLCLQSRCVSVGVTLANRWSPKFATRVGSSLLDALTVPSPIKSPITVFTSRAICHACTKAIASDLITTKDFYTASATSNNPPIFLSVIRNDLIILHAPQNMSHADIHYSISIFHIWTQYKPTVGVIRACCSVSIKYQSTEGTAACSWYIFAQYSPFSVEARHTLRSHICELNRLRNRYFRDTRFW